jgi:hypothetical protein
MERKFTLSLQNTCDIGKQNVRQNKQTAEQFAICTLAPPNIMTNE